MVSATVARNIVGIIGNVISFGLFLYSRPTFYRIIKNKSVDEDFQPDLYIATALNCMLWVFYGMPFVHPDSILIVTSNSIGLVIELAYLVIFLIFADNKRRTKVGVYFFIEVIFVAIIVRITMLDFHGTKVRSFIVGIICNIFDIMRQSSPLAVMRYVIRTKSVKYIPFTLLLTNFLNGCVWTTYALIKFDIYMLISNGVRAISGLLQLILYAYYSMMGSKSDEITKKEPNKIMLSNFYRTSKARHTPKGTAIYTVQPRDSVQNIEFTEAEANLSHQPHNDALVVTLTIANLKVHRVLVDGGSATDVLSWDAFNAMKLCREQLRSSPTILVGFGGTMVHPEGCIELPVTFGEGYNSATRMVNFLVVNSVLTYNAILGRPSLHNLKAIPSTYHQIMKFPTPGGIGEVRGE